jgi:hypothetical protein
MTAVRCMSALRYDSCTLYVQLRRMQVAHATAAFFTRPALLIRAVAPYAIERLSALAAIAIAMHTCAVVRRVLLSTLYQCSAMTDYPIASTIAALHRVVALLNESPAGPSPAGLVGLSTARWSCCCRGGRTRTSASSAECSRARHAVAQTVSAAALWPCMQRATHTCTCHTACSAHLSYGMQRTPVIRHAAHTWYSLRCFGIAHCSHFLSALAHRRVVRSLCRRSDVTAQST